MPQNQKFEGIIYRDFNRKIEFDRVVPIEELRVEERSGKRILSGYASIFNQETVIADWFREIIRPGAYTKTIQEFDQAALWNHDSGKPLARRSKNTLTLIEDEKGLRFSIELGNQSWANDAYESIVRGDVQGMSFGFQIIKYQWTDSQDVNGLDLREILEVKLYEVSPVTFPAYQGTSVLAETARSIVAGHKTNTDQSSGTTCEPEKNHSTNAEHREPESTHSKAESILSSNRSMYQILAEAETLEVI